MNTDFYLARLDRLTEEYLADCEKLERARKPTEMFGLKFGAPTDPRHDRFLEDMGDLLGDFAAAEPDSAAVRGLLETLYSLPLRRPEPKSAYWMLVAVQGLTRELIPRLGREDAAALLKAYESAWPRRMRLPVQTELVKLLRAQGK